MHIVMRTEGKHNLGYGCVCVVGCANYDDVMKISTIHTCPCHLAKLSCSLCCGDVAREVGYPIFLITYV